MRILLIVLLVLATINSFAQSYSFKNADKFSEWLMRYQENPEPQKISPAFEFAVNSKEIAAAGSRLVTMAFFSSLFRADSSLLPAFYKKAISTNSVNFHYGFVGALWLTNTPASKSLLEKYLQSAVGRKYVSDGLEKKRPYDIYYDSISQASQLDLIWADFFATGNPEDIKRIISVLGLNNPIAEAAQWSLTSNGTRYRKVYQLVQIELKANHPISIKQKLTAINKDIADEAKANPTH